MIQKIALFSLVFSMSFSAASAQKPLFTNQQIDQFMSEVKKSEKIPAKAVDMVFSFYKSNRESAGGLQNGACVDKPGYRLRYHDKKFLTKEKLKKGIRNESCLCVMDYTKDKFSERGHCVFLEAGKTPRVESFLVTHGRGSKEEGGKPMTFTNKTSPTGTTLSGLFITGPSMFQFQSLGGSDYGRYKAPGLALYGVENTNWTASRVGKVSHGAPYVRYNDKKKSGKEVGLSKGCPAIPVEKARTILPKCEGAAAWLNYTVEVAKKESMQPTVCSQTTPAP